jgi:phosphatidylinositol alpha-1,6-mannosyltransferase
VSRRRILFITRKYPPVRGGMEQYSHGLYNAWAQREDVTLLANPGGNAVLASFFRRAASELLRTAHRFDLIYLADGVLSALIPIIRMRSRARVGITVHGLDITYDRYGFQRVFPALIARADRVVCVSSHTRDAAIQRGVPTSKLIVIPNGLDLSELPRNNAQTRRSIEDKHGFALDREVLLILGRLVERKGHAWFVRQYMPRLARRFLLVIAGSGPEHAVIEAAARELGLESSVRLIGAIDEEEKAFWLEHAAALLMPNIPVPNDPEGFGISVLEAVAFGLPVFTTGIEGIADQMHYCQPLARVFDDPLPRPTADDTARLRASFDWNRVVESYVSSV